MVAAAEGVLLASKCPARGAPPQGRLRRRKRSAAPSQDTAAGSLVFGIYEKNRRVQQVIKWPTRKQAAQPKTVAGQWLLAGILVKRDLRDQLAKSLNGGESAAGTTTSPRWSRQPARSLPASSSPEAPTARKLAAFVTKMRSLILARNPDANPAGQDEAEAAIHVGLGHPGIDLSRFRKSAMLHARGAVIAGVCSKLGMSDEVIAQMIVDGEQLAFERGWHPPLAGA